MTPLLWFLPCEKQQICGTAEFLVGPTSRNQFFLLNQTVFGVAAGEPHPQPRYQTGTEKDASLTFSSISIYFLTGKINKLILRIGDAGFVLEGKPIHIEIRNS